MRTPVFLRSTKLFSKRSCEGGHRLFAAGHGCSRSDDEKPGGEKSCINFCSQEPAASRQGKDGTGLLDFEGVRGSVDVCRD